MSYQILSYQISQNYLMKNVKRHRKFQKYAAKILKTVKSAKFEWMTNQVAINFNDLNIEFKKN